MVEMRGQEAIDWIHGRYGLGAKEGLTNTRLLLARLGNPQSAYPCVHVAGTNGKGSVCSMIASALRACGYRVGLYTSPYLQSYHERIRVDGAPISDEELGAVATLARAQVEDMEREGCKATVFEIGTACAFAHFARARVDVAVIEVGLGGRLDPTNVIEPALSVIAHIGLDHEKILGDTIAGIAAEKAGIVKAGVPCVLYPQDEPAAAEVIAAQCARVGAPLADAGEVRLENLRSDARGHCFDARANGAFLEGVTLRLPGEHQLDNARTALAALFALRERGFALPGEGIARGLAEAAWPGRLEWLDDDLLLDGAHNPQGAAALADYARQYLAGRKIALVCGIQRHKPVEGIVERLVPLAERVFCVRVDSPHPTEPADLAALFRARGAQAEPRETVEDALAAARVAAGEGGVVLVCGSLYLVGEVRRGTTMSTVSRGTRTP